MGAKPPEKGVFPLDHFGECKQVGWLAVGPCAPSRRPFIIPHSSPPLACMHAQLAEAYLACLHAHRADAQACNQVSKEYLECRMARWDCTGERRMQGLITVWGCNSGWVDPPPPPPKKRCLMMAEGQRQHAPA